MLEDGEIYPSGKSFEEKIEVSRRRVEIAEQGRASEQNGLDWSELLAD